MRRVGFYMRVRAGAVDEYVAAHRPEAVWPSIVEACKRAGLRNYSLWLGGPDGRTVVGYFEAEDPERALAALAADPANEPWQAHMAPLMDVTGSFGADEPMRFMTEIFHLP